jgi:LDH2 family malate/lactate/ureidoglycolate dehydrogenase
MDVMIRTIRNSAKAKGQERIYIHGEKEWELEEDYRKNGVPLYFRVWESLRDLAKNLDIEFDL